jgi:hypothetical protein
LPDSFRALGQIPQKIRPILKIKIGHFQNLCQQMPVSTSFTTIFLSSLKCIGSLKRQIKYSTGSVASHTGTYRINLIYHEKLRIFHSFINLPKIFSGLISAVTFRKKKFGCFTATIIFRPKNIHFWACFELFGRKFGHLTTGARNTCTDDLPNQ